MCLQIQIELYLKLLLHLRFLGGIYIEMKVIIYVAML